MSAVSQGSRERKQQGRRRLRTCHLTVVNSRCLKLYHPFSILFHSSNVGKVFLKLNSKGLYQSSEKKQKKKRESCCLVFPASTKAEIRHFHVVIVQRGQRNIQNNCDTRAKLLFCLINLLLFCRFRCRRRRRCLSSLNHEDGLFQLTE